jgi:3-deoxy-manno-octulosonate cytidylyltransferase (CMP-KDO synthetase)
MSIVAIIPARYQSTRFPGKPLADINGKTMIQRVYEQAKKVGRLNRVIIATDDKRIFDHARNIGAEVMMTSDKHRNGTERIAEVVKKLETKYDAVLNIQGDEPFVKPQQIALLCNIIEISNSKIATLCKKIDNDDELESPNVVKVVMNKEMNAMYFSRFAIPYDRQKDGETSYYKHIGMYAFKSDILNKLVKLNISPLERSESLEQLRWLESGYSISLGITSFDSFGIDTPQDLTNALKQL